MSHSDPRRSGDVRDSQADQTRLRALFPDVEPVSLTEGLRATVEWFRTLDRGPRSTSARHDGGA
jgi:UDP-glucose 4-epimerase